MLLHHLCEQSDPFNKPYLRHYAICSQVRQQSVVKIMDSGAKFQPWLCTCQVSNLGHIDFSLFQFLSVSTGNNNLPCEVEKKTKKLTA